MNLSQTPSIRQVTVRPTPKVVDTIIYDLHDTRLPAYKTPPDYGTAHPKPDRYPGHKLVLVTPADEGGWSKWYYAADRDDQDDYNYSITFPYGGDVRFPRVTRTYIVPRGTSPLTVGEADTASIYTNATCFLDANGEAFMDAGSTTEAIVSEITLTPGVLVGQSERPLEGEIGSLYVEQTRVFDTIPGYANDSAEGLEQNDNGYVVQRPLATGGFLRLTWKITLPREIADGGRSLDFRACPIEGYTGLLLVDEKIEASEDNNQTSEIIRVYEGNESGAAFPSTDVVVGQELKYPGALPPTKFVDTITDTERTVEIDTPEAALLSEDGQVPSGRTVTQISVLPDNVLRGKKRYSFSTLTVDTLTGRQWDSNLNAYLTYTTEVVTPAEAADRVAADGSEISVTPYSPSWSIVTTETPTPSTLLIPTKKYFTTHPYSWPPVLKRLIWGNIGIRPAPGEDPDGSAFYYDYLLQPSWSGLCKAEVTVFFSATNPILAATDIPTGAFETSGIEFQWPGVAAMNVPPCIHEAYTFIGRTGTDHPRYADVAYTASFPSSKFDGVNISNWPESIVIDYDVTPYKGGYLVRQVKVFRPFNPLA